MPGAFADPEALVGASDGATAKGETVPKPLRNPKR